MMNKLLILMLVFGMASAASAVPLLTVTLDPTGSGPEAAGPVSIDVVSDSSTDPYDYFLKIEDTTYGDFTSITIWQPHAGGGDAGDDAATEDFGAALGVGTHTWRINALDTGEPFNLAAGVQFTVTIGFTGAAVGQDLTLTLLNGSLASIDSYTMQGIPEPMTIALLGLGGLFLRRRK